MRRMCVCNLWCDVLLQKAAAVTNVNLAWLLWVNIPNGQNLQPPGAGLCLPVRESLWQQMKNHRTKPLILVWWGPVEEKWRVRNNRPGILSNTLSPGPTVVPKITGRWKKSHLLPKIALKHIWCSFDHSYLSTLSYCLLFWLLNI